MADERPIRLAFLSGSFFFGISRPVASLCPAWPRLDCEVTCRYTRNQNWKQPDPGGSTPPLLLSVVRGVAPGDRRGPTVDVIVPFGPCCSLERLHRLTMAQQPEESFLRE